MPDPVVIFRTHSDVEAAVVLALLDAHDIEASTSSDVPHAVFPLSVDGLGEVRLTVSAEEAARASDVIASYRDDRPRGRAYASDEDDALEAALGYHFRDRGLLEHALTHRSRANEDVTGGGTENESLEGPGAAALG